MTSTTENPPTTVEVRLIGNRNDGDMHEVTVDLWAVPRKGDLITAWTGDLRGELYARVVEVAWPAWQYAHDPGVQVPAVQVGREDLSDEEWADFFDSIRERRHP